MLRFVDSKLNIWDALKDMEGDSVREVEDKRLDAQWETIKGRRR